jgi:hypothetical protein
MTLKEINESILNFFGSHLQVNMVTILDSKGFIGNRTKEYMIANVNYLNSSISGKIRYDNFQVTLADLLSPDKSNEFDIYDSAMMISEDLFTFLQYHNGFTYNKNSSIEKFTEDDGDRICGISFRVQLQSIRTQNTCSIPNAVIDINPPVSGLSVFPYSFPFVFGGILPPVSINKVFPYSVPFILS